MNETLKHALALTTFGFSIIPIDSQTKKPLIEWQKYQTTPATKEEIISWFEKYPEAGIAIVTGKVSGICVVDVDPRNGGYFPSHETVSVKTGGNGFHYYFAYPKEGISTHPSFIKGVDFKSDGGYVICPPSKHSSGGTYEWLKSPSKIAIAELPEFVKEKLEQKSNTVTEFDLDLLGGVPEGQRNEVAAKVAGKLLRNAKQEDLPVVWQLFVSWNEKNTPPMDQRELKSVFDSIAKKESRNINNAGNPIISDTFLSSVPKLIGELTEDQTKVDWIWEGYIAKGHLTFFSALWKVGKSTLTSYLLKAIQEKKEFAGQPIKPVKTLILTEESETIWARRREDLGLSGDIYLHCRPTKIKLDNRQWLQLLESNVKFCQEKGIELFIIDTISTFWPVKDEGNNPEIDGALLPLNSFLEKDIAVMPIHHFRKSGGTEGTATRGGGGIGSRADILLEFTRLEADNPNSTQRVLRAYSRFDETPPELVVDLVGDEYLPRGTRSEVSKEAKIKIVLSILEDQPDSTIKEIADSWDAEGSKPVIRTIRNYIDTLLNDGRVIQTGKKLVGKTEAPTYSINNAGKESNSLYTLSSDTNGLPNAEQITQEKKDTSSIGISSDKKVDQMSKEQVMEVFKNA